MHASPKYLTFFSFVLLAGCVTDASDPSAQSPATFETHNVAVKVPAAEYVQETDYDGRDSRVRLRWFGRNTGEWEEQSYTIQVPSQDSGLGFPETTNFRRPASFSTDVPWRPKRYFGPFRTGSDLQQIQIQLHGNSAHWFYNRFFESIDPAAVDDFKLDIFRVYYRQDYATDPISAAILPANSSPSIFAVSPSIPTSTQSEGYAQNIMFALQEVAYVSRYGGSLHLRFTMADVTTPNRTELAPEDFDYEFGRYGGVGSQSVPSWKFDVENISMSIYVKPIKERINPKGGPSLAIVGEGPFVEFSVGDFVAYKDDIAQPQGVGLDVLRSILKQVAANAGTALGGRVLPAGLNRSADLDLFSHAWIHNQHQSLIGENEKVTSLVIADDWSDITTEEYKPVVFVKFRILSLIDERDTTCRRSEFWHLDQCFEGDEGADWRVRLRSGPILAGEFVRQRQRIWELADGEQSSFTTIIAASPLRESLGTQSECEVNEQQQLRLKIRDEDLIHDDRFGRSIEDLRLDCATFENLAISGAWPTGIVLQGVQIVDPSPNDASPPFQIIRCENLTADILADVTNNISRSACFGDQGELIGTTNFGPEDFEGLFPPVFATMRWEARAIIGAR